MQGPPEISVILPVRHAALTIRNTLADLLRECRGCNAELIVAVSEGDETVPVIQEMETPPMRVLVQPPGCGVPQLRRDAVLAARAPRLVITEDHCTFAEGWLARLATGLRERGGVVGGPVSNGRRTFAGWAQYFTRYAAFLPHSQSGPTAALPGNNAIYSRSTMEPHLHLLKEGFWEAEFNHALKAAGCYFWTDPNLSVEQHQERGALAYLSLRYRHGRCFGWRRGRNLPRAGRYRLLLTTPLVPFLLYLRAARQILRNRRFSAMFCITTPLLLGYFSAWAVGEAAGYAAGPGSYWWDTD